MTLSALDLLSRLSFAFQAENEVFSKEEIRQKINEIKYLSTQRKIPKITLRKEIIHLENQFKKIEFLESALERQRRLEKSRIAALKKQNEALKKQLALSGNKDLTQKVNTLTHIIGNTLAQSEVKKDVELSEQVAMEIKEGWTSDSSSSSQSLDYDRNNVSEEDMARINFLNRRIEMLRQELEITQYLDSNKEKTKIIETQIKDLEDAILKFTERHPEMMVHELGTAEFNPEKIEEPEFEEPLDPGLSEKDSSSPELSGSTLGSMPSRTSGLPGIKHDLIFHPLPSKPELNENNDLPLPPPPKRMV